MTSSTNKTSQSDSSISSPDTFSQDKVSTVFESLYALLLIGLSESNYILRRWNNKYRSKIQDSVNKIEECWHSMEELIRPLVPTHLSSDYVESLKTRKSLQDKQKDTRVTPLSPEERNTRHLSSIKKEIKKISVAIERVPRDFNHVNNRLIGLEECYRKVARWIPEVLGHEGL